MEKQDEEVPQLIHGVLDVTIFEAVHLHHLLHGTLLKAQERLEEALHLKELRHRKLYATVDIGIARVARTREVEFQSTNPKWNESFRIYCSHTSSSIVISIKDQHIVGGKVIGRAKIPAVDVLRSELIEGWFDIYGDNGDRVKEAQVRASLKFFEAASDPFWNAGINLPAFNGIPNSYFQERTGCEVTLYQNTHLSNSFHPHIRLAGHSKAYHPRRLWEDLYIAISDAEHFVYVAGWSVNVNTTLVRDPERMIPRSKGISIGELLKRKADEGVLVLVMVWQDRTSLSFLGNAGLMKTHDEETYHFFEGSKVRCFLCPRNADPSLTAVQHLEVKTEFTHHQKTVSLDVSDPGNGKARRVASFIGGIDLCGGRYDDEKHTLFGGLDTVYKNDFLQNNFPDASLRLGGPREPWHDLHSKLEGAAAWDVLTNFEQRWKKQAPKEFIDCLLNVHERPDVFPFPSNLRTSAESWNVQVFRSIDDSSVVGFPSNPAEAFNMGLTTGKNITIDQSIHAGYIEAIRRARRFIYIENQYFIGSSFSWKQDQDAGCLNLVPIEIALKIASKIKMGERFAAYVVSPMWPEGVPEGGVVQAILHWNRLTLDMMYGIIAGAIEEAGLAGKAHPTDYLNFFCLGNRELKQPGEYVPPDRPEPETDYWKAQVNRRFLIYVHAKVMIVDDEYVIIGSANLNQRSLAGDRDSEIAHGSYQPAHLNADHGQARGLVHGYRMSLWFEHFMSHHAGLHPVFLDPESLECVRTVRRIAENLWEKYIGEEAVNLPGHLLPFPVRVSADGELSELTADGCFPDTKASVRGDASVTSLVIPPILST